jgi:ribosomal protein S18 acetylase RimI-like enzyme
MKRIEELSMNAWPCLKTNIYNGCIIRFANGYTKRANSANPLYYKMENLVDLIEKCEELYELQKLPAVFKILDSDDYFMLDKLLETKGYSKIDITQVMKLDVRKCNSNKEYDTIIEYDFSENWLKAFMNMNKVGNNAETAIKMLNNIVCQKYVASYIDNGKIAACGYGAVEDNHIGFFDIVVDENYRGKGYGRKIMEGLINRAKESNIENGYLQVVAANKVALNLYNSLGFVQEYNYWYRKK